MFLIKKLTKSLNTFETAPKAVANLSATTWFCENTSLSIANASSSKPIPIALIDKPTALNPSPIDLTPFSAFFADLDISSVSFWTPCIPFLRSSTFLTTLSKLLFNSKSISYFSAISILF